MKPLLALLLTLATLLPARAEEPPAVAMLRYAGGKTGECFSDRFLAGFDAATDRSVAKALRPVKALELTAAAHPAALLTGEGPFRLQAGEADALRSFITGGGLLIASTGCSDPAWTASLEAALPEILPADASPLTDLDAEHPAFGRIHGVQTSTYAKGPPRLPLLRGADRADGTLGFVWSPEGLNDTLGVAGPCCCCGGNEVRAAEPLLVNLLAIALDAEPAATAEQR